MCRLGLRRMVCAVSSRRPADTKSKLSHAERVSLLTNAAKLAREVSHPALPALHNIIASPWGPMLVYQWAEGDLVGAPAEKRGDPASAFQRFRALALPELVDALDVVIEVHQELEARLGRERLLRPLDDLRLRAPEDLPYRSRQL